MDARNGPRAEIGGMNARDVPGDDLAMTETVVRALRAADEDTRACDIADVVWRSHPDAAEADVRRCMGHAARLYTGGRA